jgi:hypothetical protein
MTLRRQTVPDGGSRRSDDQAMDAQPADQLLTVDPLGFQPGPAEVSPPQAQGYTPPAKRPSCSVRRTSSI